MYDPEFGAYDTTFARSAYNFKVFTKAPLSIVGAFKSVPCNERLSTLHHARSYMLKICIVVMRCSITL